MPIIASELRAYKSLQVSDTAASNGGRMSFNAVASGVNNNIFPDVPQAERLAGSTKMRKVFYKNTNSANLPLYNARLFVENYTQGDDAVYMKLGTQTDVQSGLSGSEKRYGCGKLDATVSAGANSIQVLLEDATTQFFQNGDKIRISNKTTVDAASGTDEFVTINAAPVLAGSVVTLTFTPALANGYTATASRVANVYEHGDLQAAVSAVTATTAGTGTYDNAAEPIGVTNNGTVYDDWTVNFTSATGFEVSGLTTGIVGTGNIFGDFSPVNPATSVPYFTLKSAGFKDVWATNDQLTFSTNPAAVPLWVERIVPANAAAVAGNKFVIGLDGETA